jgi:hypothetical protein
MVFSSVIFLTIFFPIMFTVYFLLHDKVKNAFLLFASIVFYMWGAPKFIFAIIGTAQPLLTFTWSGLWLIPKLKKNVNYS